MTTSRAFLAALVLGFFYVAGPVLAWTASLTGEVVMTVLFGVSFAVAMVKAVRSEFHGTVLVLPGPFPGGIMVVPPSSRRLPED